MNGQPLFGRSDLRLGCRTLATTLLCGVAMTASAFALNLQLYRVQYMDDGLPQERSCFRLNDHDEVIMELPYGWNTTSSATLLTMNPPDGSGIKVQLAYSPRIPLTPFDEPGLKIYRQQVIATLPQGSTNAKIIGERANPMPRSGWKDYEFVVEYGFYGQTFRCATLFINVEDKDQLVMTTVSPPNRFDECHEAGMAMLRSWNIVPNGKYSPADRL